MRSQSRPSRQLGRCERSLGVFPLAVDGGAEDGHVSPRGPREL